MSSTPVRSFSSAAAVMAFPRISFELGRTFPACLSATERSRPRCVRPTSTHPSSRPREPVPSCVPSSSTELALRAHLAGLVAPRAASPPSSVSALEPRAVHRKAWTCRCVRPGRCAFHDARARFGESPSPISRCFLGVPRERVFSIRCLTFRHHRALSARLDSTRASRVCAGDRDRFHRLPREEHSVSAIQKAFPRRAPRPFPSARRTHEQPCSDSQAAPGGAGTSGPLAVTRALT
jgi:hypothetical protein